VKHLIAGFGDVGRGLYELMQENKQEVVAIDKDTDLEGKFDILHVCFPYSAKFVDFVNNYIARYQPSLVIIHSTVPPGTTDSIALVPTVHSPVRGRHPSMARDMKIYTKYVGGKNPRVAGDILRDCGFKVREFSDAKVTELGKLLSNIRWGLNLAFAQEQKKMCEHYGVDYKDVVNEFEFSRNNGLVEIGREGVKMPILYPGYIGGHCVMPNVDILFAQFPSIFLKVIKESNEKYNG
jgi:UDP-N-acetyl-D-mannosaminuronate dehydrogenase